MQSFTARARTAGVAQTSHSRPSPPQRLRTTRAYASGQEASTSPTGRIGDGVIYTLALSAPSLAFGQALADDLDAAPPPPEIFGLPAGTAVLLLAPAVLYTIFTVYRTSFNPRAKISDYLFAVGALAVFANLASIIFYKIRFF